MGDYEDIDGALVHRLANIVGDVALGKGSRVDAFVTLTGKVRIGRCSHIATGACIFGGEGFEMGDFCGLSPGAKIFTATEDLSGEWLMCPTSPAHLRRVRASKIKVGNHCTIGANSILLPGAGLEDGACVGSLSLVKTQLQGWAIYAGVPVKLLKLRDRRALQLAKDIQ